MKLIDIDAVVAEIKRKLQDLIVCKKDAVYAEERVILRAKIDMCKEILSLLDTLEVKEVREETVNEDLEEAAEEYAPDFSNSIASKAAVDAIRDAFKAGAQWQALHSLETIKGMEEQAFLSGVEAEQINKSFSKEELLNRWRNNYDTRR